MDLKFSMLFFVKENFSTLNESNSKVLIAFAKHLKRFLEHNSARLTLFFPGAVLKELFNLAPQEMTWLRDRVQEAKLEIMGGTLNDSMPPFFPSELQDLQLKKMKSEILKSFKIEPVGYFNSSFVWELGMIELLNAQDFKYTLINESCLRTALGRTTPVSGWFTTEDKGAMIRLISVSESISKALLGTPEGLLESLELLPKNDKIIVTALEVPLESIEVLDLFFDSLEKNLELVKPQTWTIAHVIEQQSPDGKVNLMSALGTDLGLPEGAHSCRELLIRRPEINFFHKSFLAVYRYAIEHLKDKELERIKTNLLSLMSPFYFRDLYANEGFKNPKIRKQAYLDLITTLTAVEYFIDFKGIRIDLFDYLLNGEKQVWVNNSEFSMLIDHSRGAYLRSLFYKSTRFNLISSMRDDGDVSIGFMDHILPSKVNTLAGFISAVEDRNGVLTESADYEINRERKWTHLQFLSEQVFSTPESKHIFQLSKQFSLSTNKSKFELKYRLTNSTYIGFDGYFGTELELGLEEIQLLKINGVSQDFDKNTPILLHEVSALELHALSSFVLQIEFSCSTHVLLSPILGMDQYAAPMVFHGLRLFLFWNVELSALETELFSMKLKLSKRRLSL